MLDAVRIALSREELVFNTCSAIKPGRFVLFTPDGEVFYGVLHKHETWITTRAGRLVVSLKDWTRLCHAAEVRLASLKYQRRVESLATMLKERDKALADIYGS